MALLDPFTRVRDSLQPQDGAPVSLGSPAPGVQGFSQDTQTPSWGGGATGLPGMPTINTSKPLDSWGWGNEPRMPDTPTASGPSAFGGGNFQDWFMGALQGKPFNQQTLLDLEGLLNQSGSRLTPANAQGERTKIWDPTKNDWVRVGFGEGTPQWIYQGWGQQGPNMQAQPQGQPGQVFSDPATSEWEQLLRTINTRLQQPQPTYTDAQRDLMQTQAIDPMERQRQAQKQNTIQRFASRGINPGSGILEQALQDVDRQFDQMRTGQQSQFALNQIGREDQLFNSNEQRALAGLNLFGQIPQLADKRLGMAQGSLMQSNPFQLMQLQNQINQQGQQQQNYNQGQDQQFWNWIGQMLAGMF